MKKYLVIAAVWTLLLGNVGLAYAVCIPALALVPGLGPAAIGGCAATAIQNAGTKVVSGTPVMAPDPVTQAQSNLDADKAMYNQICASGLGNASTCIQLEIAISKDQNALNDAQKGANAAPPANSNTNHNLGTCQKATPVQSKTQPNNPDDYCTCQQGSTLGPKAQVMVGATPGANCLKLPVCKPHEKGDATTGCACSADSNSEVVAPGAQVDSICSSACSGGGSGEADSTAAAGDQIKNLTKALCSSGNANLKNGNPAGAPADGSPAGGSPAGGAPAGGAPAGGAPAADGAGGAGGANPAGGGMGDMMGMMMPMMMMGMMAPMMIMPLISALPTLLSSLTNKNSSGSNNCTSGTGNTATNSGATSGTCSSGTPAAAAGTAGSSDGTTDSSSPLSPLESAVTNLVGGGSTTSGTTTPTTASTPVQEEQSQLEDDAAATSSDTATPAAATDPTQDYHGNVNQTDHRLSCALMTGGSVANCRAGVVAAPAASQ
jgi:hypothetical protein